MRRATRMPAIPNAEEAEKMMPIIREAFVAKGVEPRTLGKHPNGGVMATAIADGETKNEIINELFMHGIVMAEVRHDVFGFAVMR